MVYPLLPWTGVMLLGYGTAPLFQEPAQRRDARLLAWGVAATAAFVVLRGTGVYGEPNPWQVQDGAIGTLIDFLNVTKYPPSLLFLLMTLGPAAILCAFADRVPDAIKRPLIVFGRAPFAFYVAHLYLIHTFAVAFGVIQGFDAREFLTYSFFFPKGYGVGLPGTYAVWLLVVAMLYPLCKWVAAVKARRQDWWLSTLDSARSMAPPVCRRGCGTAFGTYAHSPSPECRLPAFQAREADVFHASSSKPS